jgi:hypothetical protein
MPDDALFLSELRKIRDETAELLEDANMWRFYDTAAKFRSRLAVLNAAIARRIAPAAEENPWKPLSDLPVPGREPVYVNVRTTITSTYRWLPLSEREPAASARHRWALAECHRLRMG